MLTLDKELVRRARRLFMSVLAAGSAAAVAGGASAQPQPVAAPAPSVSAPRVVQATPALWVVRDADSTIYLFGTFHALRPGVNWRTPVVERALAESSALYLEVEDPTDVAAVQRVTAELGIDRTTPLTSRLNDADRRRLAAAAQSLGIPMAQLEPMRPWMASMVFPVVQMMRAGFDPNQGVDKLIRDAAAARGVPVRGFETPEQQVRFLAELPEATQIQLLRQTLADAEGGTALLDRRVSSWMEGDAGAIGRTMVDDIRGASPELYRVLLTDRNVAWTRRIRELLAGSGTVFVAVGAGHLAGPDSVQVHLERAGVQVERVDRR